MKKIILGAALCGLLAAGCSLDKSYLNGPNALTFPASKAEVEAGVFAAYKGLTLIDASSTPFPGIQDNASDIGASRLNAANYNYQQQSKLPTDNAWVEKVYNNIYKTAARANLVLDGIDKVRDLMSEQEYNMYKAELLLTRAYVYEWGCQLYGDIPYIDHVLGLGDSYTRTPRAEVIDKILNEDLKDEMLDFLPLRHNKATYGSTRLGRVGAYGLKARICLNWGFFEEAAKYADKALTLAKDAGYALEPYDTRFCGEDYTKGEPSATNLFGLSGPRQQRRMDLGLAVQRHDIGQPAQRRILRRTAHRRRLLLFQPHADVHRRDPVHRRQIDRRIAAVRLQGALGKTAIPVSTSSACGRVRACWVCSSKPTPRFRRS